MRLYETKNLVRYECLKVESLLSPTPLHLYSKGARLGVDYIPRILTGEMIKISDELTATNTIIGWTCLDGR